MMAEMKTTKNDRNVNEFLQGVTDEKRRKDCYVILDLMKQATQAEAKMWGSSIIGFGDTHYKYASGREGDWFEIGFSPRVQNLTLYFNTGFAGYGDMLQRLGKYKTGKGCLYIQKIDDIHVAVLKELIQASVDHMRKAGM